jgi:hypothetical protein
MDKSTFNGLNYDLKINRVKPQVEQFKFGIIFDISERDYDKKLVKEGYYKDYLYDSLYVDPRDSNKIYLPCNCPCDKEKNTETSQEEDQGRPYEGHTPIIFRGGSNTSGSGGRIRTGGGGSGGSRGSFPGIRTSPAPRPSGGISR